MNSVGIVVRTLFVAAIAVLAVSFSNPPAHAGEEPEATTYLAKLKVGRSELQCDGDSTYLLLEIRTLVGDQPAAGVGVKLSAKGVFTSNGDQTTDSFEGVTDSRGIVRVRFAPKHVAFSWILVVQFGEQTHPSQYFPTPVGSCAFTADREYVVRGEIFVDSNSDGVRNSGEKLFKQQWIALGRQGYNFGNQIFDHHQRTDAVGGFAYTGLIWDEDRPWQLWEMCLGVQETFLEGFSWSNETHPYPRKVNATDDDYAIVSVNGVVDATKPDCHPFGLVAGVNTLSIGVQRVP